MKRWCTQSMVGVALWAATSNGLVNTATNRHVGRMGQQQSQCLPRHQLETHLTGGGSGRSATQRPQRPQRPSQLQMARSPSSDPSREDEIREKILELKQDGKIKPKQQQQQPIVSSSPFDTPIEKRRKEVERMQSRSVGDEYAGKLGEKLGGRKGREVGRMIGIDVPITQQTTDDSSEEKEKRKPKLGALDVEDLEGYDDDDDDDDEEEDDDIMYLFETEDERRERMVISSEAASDAIGMLRRNVDEEEEKEMDEEDMMAAVAKLLAKKGGEYQSIASLDVLNSEDGFATVPSMPASADGVSTSSAVSSVASKGGPTSGVGGAWSPPEEDKKAEDDYQPKVGTWGAFPRPRNISVAYGGGKRVGAGFTPDQKLKQESIDSTKDRLKSYRQKMGIEVQSEKDYADVIEEALQLAARAMQRGSYSAGVSALEKVTQYCSTKSEVGGKVFLELAMAYEAEGKTNEAIGLYAALTKSPIETIKMNADKLLYGLEAMNFMRNEANLKDFQRKKAADTFIDATGFADMTQNFDDVYNTAYIDLDKGGQYYRMLSENVVRSTREARQILLKAVNKDEVPRMKIVQALRSISRHFDDALVAEKENEAAKNVPVDYAGRPIVNTQRSTQDDLASAIGMDGFVLTTPAQTLDNLEGEWRLQLMGDRKGEGVDFFNSTLMWQSIDASEMAYISGSKGLRASSQSGDLKFDKKDRILSRETVETNSGGGFLSMLLGGGGGTAGEMTKVPQQVLSVDSALLVSRAIVKAQAADNVKDYFAVWRRVEPGTFASDR